MKRQISAKLEAWKRANLRNPLILKGARQVGKTYSLKEFGKTSFSNFLYVNFEEDEQLEKIFAKDLNPERILDELSFYLDNSFDREKDLLIFDEIQYCPRALTSLKYFSEKLPGTAVCCAGSLLGLQVGLGSFPVGKVDFMNMHPMSFEEFLLGTGETRAHEYFMKTTLDEDIPEIVHARLWELFKLYLVTGGLPAVVNVYLENKDNLYQAMQRVRAKQDDLILGYEADMAKHCGKQNSMHINRLWRNIPAQLAREQDGSAPKFKFKDVIPGVRGYSRLAGIIDWLETAGLIIKSHYVSKPLLPFTAFSAENQFKLFYFDVGILGAISKLPPKTILGYGFGTYQGYLAENLVTQEFVNAGGGGLVSWKEVTSEVEFLREVDGRVLPVEVKSGWVTQAKSLNVYAQKYEPDYRVIMSAKNKNIDHQRGVHRYPLYLAGRFPLSP